VNESNVHRTATFTVYHRGPLTQTVIRI